MLRGRRPRARWARSAAFPQLLRKHDLAGVLGFNFTDVLPPAEGLPGRRVDRRTRSLRRRTKIPRYARILIIYFSCGGMSCSCQWYRVCDAGALRAEPLATLMSCAVIIGVSEEPRASTPRLGILAAGSPPGTKRILDSWRTHGLHLPSRSAVSGVGPLLERVFQNQQEITTFTGDLGSAACQPSAEALLPALLFFLRGASGGLLLPEPRGESPVSSSLESLFCLHSSTYQTREDVVARLLDLNIRHC